MTNEMFKKEAFKKSVKDNVKFLYRKTIEEATQLRTLSLITGWKHRKLTTNRTQRLYITCPWNSLWDVPWATISSTFADTVK